MSFLLDTCVLSELIKPTPDPSLTEWVSSQREFHLFLSVVTIGELQKGITRLPPSRRRSGLERWLELMHRFEGRILKVDFAVARQWGAILGESETRGRPLPAIDTLIAATAMVHGCAVVTRNESDLRPTGVDIINPWG